MQARTSASSRPGYSLRISWVVIPLARRSRIRDTQIRCPLIHGFPKQIFGSIEIRKCKFFLVIQTPSILDLITNLPIIEQLFFLGDIFDEMTINNIEFVDKLGKGIRPLPWRGKIIGGGAGIWPACGPERGYNMNETSSPEARVRASPRTLRI
jgi:hypothetical protein